MSVRVDKGWSETAPTTIDPEGGDVILIPLCLGQSES